MSRYEDLSLSYISESLLRINLWRISLCEVNFQPPFYLLFCSQEVKKKKRKKKLICRSEKEFLSNTQNHNFLFLLLEEL